MKKILIILLVLAVIFTAGFIYLNKVVIPTKIKSLVVKKIEDATQKKVKLDSLRLNILGGLVLTNLVISDDKEALLSVKNASFNFLIWPFFKKKIIIPSISIESPVLFLKRNPDNSFNISGIIPKKPASTAKEKNGFDVYISAVSVSDGCVEFTDKAVDPGFSARVENIDLGLRFGLPADVKFHLSCSMKKNTPVTLKGYGEYKIFKRELDSKFVISDFPLKELNNYYANTGIDFPQGTISGAFEVAMKNQAVEIGSDFQCKAMTVTKDMLKFNLDSGIKANFKYSFGDKQIFYSGTADITKMDILGIKSLKEINRISGLVRFDTSGLVAERLNANIFSLPVELNLGLKNFKDPFLRLEMKAQPELGVFQAILQEQFKYKLPAQISGQSNLYLNIKTNLSMQAVPQVNGYIDISDGAIKPDKTKQGITGFTGRLNFDQNSIEWQTINFRYLDTGYKTSGSLVDFKSPNIKLELYSKDLALFSKFDIKEKILTVSGANGKYLNSTFNLSGSADTADVYHLKIKAKAQLDLELNDLGTIFQRPKAAFAKISPEGKVKILGDIAVDGGDLRSSAINAKVSGSSLTLWGLKIDSLNLDYSQSDAVADISNIGISLYGGNVNAKAEINLAKDNVPFSAGAVVQNLKLEKLKMDTPLKKENVSGSIQTSAKFSGFLKDASALEGEGKIVINDGRLWQLNLFKGMGTLLFTRDFTDIVFTQGSCSFFIKDRHIFTNDLFLKSALAEISGNTDITFDGAIDATLNVHVADDIPLTGTFKDITTAILGKAGKFGIITISGTIKEPKYKFKTSVTDILKSLKDVILDTY